MADIGLPSVVYLPFLPWHALHASCNFASKQAISISPFGLCPNDKYTTWDNHFPMFSWVVFIMSRIACWVECTLQNPYWDGERENERFHSREDQFFQDPIKVRQQRNRPIVVCVMVINLQNYKSQLRDRRDRSPTTEQDSHKLHHHHQSMHFYSTQYPNVTDSFF